MDQVARHTKRLLEENGWSCREQEVHTGVKASVVYDMTLMRPVPRDWLRQFASVASALARDDEAREFWGLLTGFLSGADVPRVLTADDLPALDEASAVQAAEVEAADALLLFQGLREPSSRRAALRLLADLAASEEERRRASTERRRPAASLPLTA